jgi:hypothetical protein
MIKESRKRKVYLLAAVVDVLHARAMRGHVYFVLDRATVAQTFFAGPAASSAALDGQVMGR